MYARPSPLQRRAFGDRNGQVELAGAAPLEVLAVVVRHAEQLADHQRRDGQREVLHQIDGRPGGFHRVELLIDDLGDAWFQALHPADGELGGEHAAQPLVFGRVEAEQVARPRAGLLLLGHTGGRPRHGESGRSAVGEPL